MEFTQTAKKRAFASTPLGAILKAYVSLIRVPYIIVLDLLCVLLILTFHKGLGDPATMVLAILTVSFVVAGSTAINDCFDCESDRLTHPERVIPSNQISRTRATAFAVLTFFAALVVAYTINALAFGIVVLDVVLFVLYPSVFKQISGFLSNLVMGFLAATIALFAGAVVFKTIGIASLSFVGTIAAAAIGLNVLKDGLTVDGDLRVGYSTVAIKHGMRVAVIVGAVFLLLSVFTSPLPFVAGVEGYAYLVPIALWAAIGCHAAFSLLRTPNRSNVRKQLTTFTSHYLYFVGAASVGYVLAVAVWGF
jgi:geranylgeranylglycerol-phosphate geranylgeranyltransferase